MTYEGWANYETWTTHQWMLSDGEDEYWCERARIALRGDSHEEAIYVLAGEMRDEIRENVPEVKRVYFDLLHAGIGNINFFELAKSFIRLVEENEGKKVEEHEAFLRRLP